MLSIVFTVTVIVHCDSNDAHSLEDDTTNSLCKGSDNLDGRCSVDPPNVSTSTLSVNMDCYDDTIYHDENYLSVKMDCCDDTVPNALIVEGSNEQDCYSNTESLCEVYGQLNGCQCSDHPVEVLSYCHESRQRFDGGHEPQLLQGSSTISRF